MSDDYGDTSAGSEGASQASNSEATDPSQDTGDTGSGSEAEGPVPYERFKESRDQLSSARGRADQLEQQLGTLQSQYQETAQWNQWAWREMQNSQSQPEQKQEADDVYADPLEKKVKVLESQMAQQKQFFDYRHQEMQVAQAERDLRSEINSVRGKFPEMRELDVINAVIQNPQASIAALAKRSHEAEVSRFESRLRQKGYKQIPKSLQKGGGKVAIKKDYGDDMEAAEAAAIAYLGDD